MIELGTVVEATVVRAMEFGVFFEYNGDRILVPLNNLTWRPLGDTISSFLVGSKASVLVERLNYEKGEYSGNIKALTPEENPYRELARLPVGAVIVGQVKLKHPNGVVVHLNEWCTGELPIDEQTDVLSVGDNVEVTITSLELDQERVTLALARRSETAGQATMPS